MSIKLDCQHYCGDKDCMKCGVMGYILDCPAECSEYVDYFGRQPYKEDLEKKIKG